MVGVAEGGLVMVSVGSSPGSVCVEVTEGATVAVAGGDVALRVAVTDGTRRT